MILAITLVCVVVGVLGFVGCAYVDDRLGGGSVWVSLAYVFAVLAGVATMLLLWLSAFYVGLALAFVAAVALVRVVLFWLSMGITGGRFPG